MKDIAEPLTLGWALGRSGTLVYRFPLGCGLLVTQVGVDDRGQQDRSQDSRRPDGVELETTLVVRLAEQVPPQWPLAGG